MNKRFGWMTFVVAGVLAGSSQAMAAKIAPKAAAKVDAKILILPGKSIGEISLNMPRAEVLKRLGVPSYNQEVTQDFSFSQWEKKHIFVGFDGENIHSKVVLISVSDKKFHTKDGIKVGNRISLIKKKFPKGSPTPGQNIAEWHDDRMGIGFLHRSVGNAIVNPKSDWTCDEISVFATIHKK